MRLLEIVIDARREVARKAVDRARDGEERIVARRSAG
jgi:hypothetical protein